MKKQRGQKEPMCGFGYVTKVLVPTGCVPSLAKCLFLPFLFVCPHNFLIMQMHSRTSSCEHENQDKTQD